jgi:hypothetical protein
LVYFFLFLYEGANKEKFLFLLASFNNFLIVFAYIITSGDVMKIYFVFDFLIPRFKAFGIPIFF